jgi:hypothetical protein
MAAWYSIFRIDFKDVLKLDWRIDIQEYIASQGTITELIPTGNPLRIEFNGDDEYNSPIKPSKAVFNVYSTTDFSLMSLYSNEDFHYKVIIYKGAARTSIFWQGFIATGEYSEPYDPVPYPVQLTAVDGLNYLKNYLFKYTTTVVDDTYYNGRALESTIILNILVKIKVPAAPATDVAFIEYVNIYEESMAIGSGDSPMDQLQIDQDIFKDMYCWEVLSEILKKYNAVIRQWNGGMIIYRPKELLQATIYGRAFTDPDSKTAVTFATGAAINRAGTASNLLQFPGSVVMVKRPAKKITMNQDYGYKESWIDNWQFKGDTFDGTDFDYWTRVPGATSDKHATSLNYYIPSEKDGAALMCYDEPNPAVIAGWRSYFHQDFATLAISENPLIMIFELDWLIFSTSGSRAASVYIMIKNTSGTVYYAQNDGTWTTTASFIVLGDSVTQGQIKWNHSSISLATLPAAGPYRIYLVNPYYGVGGNILTFGFKNVKFYASSAEIIQLTKKRSFRQRISGNIGVFGGILSLRNKYYTVESVSDIEEVTKEDWTILNAINGNELEYDYILGDVTTTKTSINNILEQFAGSLNTLVSAAVAPSSDWNTYTGTGAGRTSGAQSKPLLEIIGDEIANQYSKPKQLLQMNIKDNDAADTVLNTLYCISDSVNLVAPAGATRKFAFNRGEIDVLNRLWTADLIEIVT